LNNTTPIKMNTQYQACITQSKSFTIYWHAFSSKVCFLNIYKLMRENVMRLMLVGFGIIIMSFMIVSNAQAQSSPSASLKYPSTIQSKEDYVKVEKMVENLMGELYKINQLYPDFSYDHNYNDSKELVSVTVNGIDNFAVADKAAAYIMDLEKLGSVIREVDAAHLPEISDKKLEKLLNEIEAADYEPEEVQK